MALSAPNAKDLFGDVSAKEAAVRMDDYNSALNKSMGNAVTDPSAIMSIQKGASTFEQAAGNPLAVLEAAAANKSLSPEAATSLNSALAAQRMAMQDIQKEITLSVPLSTSFAAFDLEAPAKLLTPRPTPLRNKIVRTKGVGTSHRVKRLLGYTGTGTGGQGNIWPGITETTTNAFGSVNYQRGPQISYTADDLVLPYNSYSLSDAVSWDANFSGLGFQDLRQLSSTSTLYATMLMEERMMLMARGTAAGFSGALAQPVIVSATAAAAGAGQTPITGYGVGDDLFIYVTADAGAFGESVLSVVATDTPAAGDVLNVVVNPVVGALGYKVYIAAAAAQPADALFFYQGTYTTPTFTIEGVLPVAGANAGQITADTSAYATGYDGILPTVLGPNSGFNNAINAGFSTTNPGTEFQEVFFNLYNNVKADPDEILMNGADRRQLSDAIKAASGSNYRLTLTQTEAGDYVGGATIGALYNEITGKMVDITVHPWLPQGVAPVLSYTLPIPDTQVSNVWANIMVQDYMGVQWPVNQFQYEFSTYFRGTFFCYAPAWNGAVSGIVAA